MGTHGVGAYSINSKFSSGNLVFYEKAYGRTTTGDVLTIGTTAVQVGNTAQAVDFSWYASGSKSFILSAAGGLSIDGIDVTLSGDLALDLTTSSLIIGSATPLTISDGDGGTNLTPEVQALGIGTTFAGGAMALATFNTTNTLAVCPKLAFVKGAAATQVPTTAVADNEVIGAIIGYGSDTGDFETPVAAIQFVVDDAAGIGASAIGGSLEFWTTADGGTTLTQAVTIGTDQHVTFVGDIVVDATTASTTTLTGSIQTDGGLGVAGATYLGTILGINSAASDIIVIANTAAALEVYDSTTKLLALDTRGTVAAISQFAFTSVASRTLPNAAAASFSLVSLASLTETLIGTTQVTTPMDGVLLSIGTPTIAQSGGAVVVDEASTVHIAAAPVAGGSVTLTAPYALYVDSGDVRFDGTTASNYLHWDDSADDLLLVGTATQLGIAGTTDASSATTGSIHTAGGIGIGMALWVGTTSKLVGAITADATLGIAGLITSTSVTGFRANPTFVPDATRTNYGLAIGTRATELSVTMAASADYNLDPMQINLNIIGTAPTSSTINGIYQNITHDTTDMPNLRLKGCDWTITTDKECQDAYVMQTELVVSGTKTSSGELMAMSALTTLGAGARTADRVLAFQAMISGDGTAGTVVGDCFVAYIVNAGTVITTDSIINIRNQSAATAISAIELELDGTVTYAIDFQGTVADAWTTATAGTSITPKGEYVLIPVDVVGTTNTLFLLAAQTHTVA